MQLRMSKKYGQGGANAPASAKGGENAMSLSKAAAQLLHWGQNKEGNIDDLGLSEAALKCAAIDLKDAHLVSEIYYSSDGVDDIALTAAGRAYKA